MLVVKDDEGLSDISTSTMILAV